MQQSNACDLASSSSAANDTSNRSNSDANSGYRFKDDLASLSEMFPACDINMLKNYLEIVGDSPDYMSIVVNMLLIDVDNTSGLNYGQNSTQQQQDGLKRKTDADEDRKLQNKDQSETVASPSKLTRVDTNSHETACVSSPSEVSRASRIFSSNTSETLSSLNTKGEPSFSKSDKIEAGSSRSPVHLSCTKPSASVDEDSEIVFVKSVASPPKQSFYRSEHSNGPAGLTSPRQRNGICIRHKGGILHPSMNKPKKLQIVEIDTDEGKGSSSVQSTPDRKQSTTSLSPRRKGLRTSKACTTTATATMDADDSNLKSCTSTGLSISKDKLTVNPSMVNSLESSGSAEPTQAEETTASNHTSCEGSSVAAALSDLEILKKVFPDADPTYISSLLDKHADKPNRVALVGKELGNNPGAQEQDMKKKVVPCATWFWESEGGKLVQFTDSECNALEKAFNSCGPHPRSVHVKDIKLPGSIKRFKVNFLEMRMACESGQKTVILRVPGGSEEKKEIGGKSLIPQEALTVPSDWQKQSGNAELISLLPGTAEWEHVQRSLKRSLKPAQVCDIQRVQNKWLYRKYAIQRHLMKDKNGPTCINEKELFHGTRQKDPEVIWTGEDGFDMRYSADGMWGRGTYFATEAKYCHHGFVHRDVRTQQFQLFLAHVLTGDSVSLPPDSSIKMPPVKRGSNIRHDSVNGVTNGCTVYILYKLDMAYPAYLITYTL